MGSVLQFLETSPTIEEVDERLRRLRDDIRTLEAYRNGRLATTSRLPSDVLSLIFEHIAVADFFYKPRELLSVSHVCREWRNISVNTPRMWCYIHANREKFTEFLLERSKQVPIYLYSQSSRYYHRTVKLALEHSHRLKSIELSDCSTELFAIVTHLHLPLLESLNLRTSHFTKGRFMSSVATGTVPTLRFLFLKRCIIDLDEPGFSLLRTLKIHFHKYTTPPLSAPYLLRILAPLKHLETLELRHAVDGSAEELHADARVHLPRLTNISMHVKNISSLVILTRLSFPLPAQSVEVTIEEQVLADEMASVASAVYAMIPTPADLWKIQTRSILCDFGCETRMSIWPGPGEGASPPFLVAVTGPRNFEADLMLHSLLPSAVRITLEFHWSISSNYAHEEENDLLNLHSYLRSLNAVQELRMVDIHTLIMVLSDTPGTEKIRSKPPPSFSLPLLKSIRLIQTGWVTKPETPTWKKLGRLLAARKAIGASVETLEVIANSYTLDSGEAEFLAEHVASFEFNKTCK